ncbi:sulfite exporter TauE/SafE family protein [Thermogemmatispora sp.]|uniref:sulfite exporter TauE/SafE family protein n=1 Tax=Thermogemmatispora sp. TaxID=1968838 RepID=UPI001DB6B140|nr:sulfite exporter TauE/SafE family protein [Thermogemmatispora sp.]MBX5448915.1 sulfite exporter TauE/SafE family protein [Thermogemmatispora sp.]
MTLPQAVLLFLAAVLGGMLNSVAGGGSFIGFPALIFTGVPSINANATNTVALWPGVVASAGAYRRELARQPRALILVLGGTSLIGGVLGALLLLRTPQQTFTLLIPPLLLIATVLFAASPRLTALLRQRRAAALPATPVATSDLAQAQARTLSAELPATSTLAMRMEKLSPSKLVTVSFFQLLIATYGGYFGGGIGILMLATLGMMGMENIHEMNGLKTLLAGLINGVAVVTFALAGAVFWPQALLMVVGAVIGGYGGAYYARKIDQRWVRLFVTLVGVAMTLYFFINIYILGHSGK